MINEILASVVDIETQALKNLQRNIMQSSVLPEIIDVLEPIAKDQSYSKRIIITGVGKNANLATKASETFCSLGLPSMYLNSCHYSHGDAGFIGPNDIIIHVSRSGKTAEVVYTARHLKTIRPGVKQILLHCNESLSEEIKSIFDYEFCTGTVIEADENNLAPTTSTTVLLALLDSIGVYLSSKNKFKRQDFLNFHPGGSLGQMLSNELA